MMQTSWTRPALVRHWPGVTLWGVLIVSILLVNALPGAAQPAKPAQQAPAHAVRNGPYRALGDPRAFDFPLMTLEVSPNRQWLAAAGFSLADDLSLIPKLMLVDVASGQAVYDLQGHERLVNQLRFSPDGKTLYSGGNPQYGGYQLTATRVSVWDVATGKLRASMAAPIWDLSPDGKLLAIAENHLPERDFGFKDNEPGPTSFTVRLLDTATWKEVVRHEEKAATLATFCFHPDGKTLALAIPKDATVRLWDWRAKKETGRLQTPKLGKDAYEQLTLLAFHPDGKRLATVTDSVILDQKKRKVVLWNLATGKVAQTYEAVEYPIMALSFSPKGDRLVVESRQNFCEVFDVASGERVRQLATTGVANVGTALSLYRAGLTPDQAANPPALMKALWDVATGKDVAFLKSRSDPLQLLTAEQLKALRDAPLGTKVYFGLKRPGQLQTFTMAPDSRTVATGDIMGVIRLWDVTTGKETAQFGDPAKSTVVGLTFARGGKRLLSSHANGTILVWDTATGKQVDGLAGATDLFPGPPAVSTAGKLASPLAKTPFILLWQHLDDKQPTKIAVPTPESFVEFTPDGKFLVSGRWRNGPVHVIDVAAAKVVRSLGRDNVEAFAVSPDGRTLATFERSADFKHTALRLWDIVTGKEKGQIVAAAQGGIVEPAHTSGYAHNSGMRFTADGRGLLVHTRSGLGLWEVATGQNRILFGGHGHTAVSANGRLVCTQGPNCVLVWDLSGRN